MCRVIDRVQLVQNWLKECGLEAIIVPTNDPHFSEYVADYWKARQWVSGFTGSAGTVVITQKESLLWCDSRYFVQADLELSDTPYKVQKMGQEGTPTVNEWLKDNISAGAGVAIDGKLLSVTAYNELQKELTGREIVAVDDPFIDMWSDRPQMPKSIVRILDDKIAGESVTSKIERVVKGLDLGSKIYLTSVLDEIAWLLNIRGADISFNPVVISYAVIMNGGAILFVDKDKLINNSEELLNENGIIVKPYCEFSSFIANLPVDEVVINPSKFDVYNFNILTNSRVEVLMESGNGIITTLKAVKNSVELRGIKRSMVDDGVALVKFNMWLERALDNDEVITESDVSRKLHEFRMSSPNFVSDSFNAIVGYASNGAIVHYSPVEGKSAQIKPEGFLLMDSGGQYEYGTTDITRTLHLSSPTEREKVDYTLVMKGNISLSMAVFPTKTTGYQLDILARQHLLRAGLNYGHGTGHGIGYYLNVHEGPQSIRADYNPTELVAGMIISNEPGLYRVGEYGIRLENVIETKEYMNNEFGHFYSFKSMTLYPFDLKCIKIGLLTTEERHWLNRYHARVFDKLSQFLTTEERFWLSNKTKAI